eukprot:2352613-Ditylum_brightwellii.AAC.1
MAATADSSTAAQWWQKVYSFWGSVGCVFLWTWLTTDDSNDDNDGIAYGIKNGVNALFHHQPP